MTYVQELRRYERMEREPHGIMIRKPPPLFRRMKIYIDQIAIIYILWIIHLSFISAAVNTTRAAWDAGILVWP